LPLLPALALGFGRERRHCWWSVSSQPPRAHRSLSQDSAGCIGGIAAPRRPTFPSLAGNPPVISRGGRTPRAPAGPAFRPLLRVMARHRLVEQPAPRQPRNLVEYARSSFHGRADSPPTTPRSRGAQMSRRGVAPPFPSGCHPLAPSALATVALITTVFWKSVVEWSSTQ
jgi:hypothetical protein